MENKFSSRGDVLRELEKAKGLARPSVKVFPGPDCKDVAVDLLKWNVRCGLKQEKTLEELAGEMAQALSDPLREIAHNVRSHHTLKITAGNFFCTALGVVALDDSSDAWMNFREAEALLHVTHLLKQAEHRLQEKDWERASGAIEDFYLFSRAIDSGDGSLAKFVGAYLHNALYRESVPIEASVQDVHFLEFMWLLVLSFAQQQWLKQDRIEESNLGIYKGLMRSVGTPAFSSALVEFLDNRLAQSFGLPYFGAFRRISGNGSEFFLPMWAPYDLFPFELLALRGVARYCGLSDVSIEVDHPTMTALSNIPSFGSRIEGALCGEIHRVGQEVYGGVWDTLQPFDFLD
jgi:hypothetical protein